MSIGTPGSFTPGLPADYATDTNKAIQVAITHTAAGVVIGSMLEMVMPPADSGSPLPNQVFELCVHMGLNGAALALLCPFLQCGGSDPTYGLPFGAALFAAQPSLQARLGHLAESLRSALVQGVLRKVTPVTTASSSN